MTFLVILKMNVIKYYSKLMYAFQMLLEVFSISIRHLNNSISRIVTYEKKS